MFFEQANWACSQDADGKVIRRRVITKSLAVALILCGAVAARGQGNTSSAFNAGQADRADWENWFSALEGDYYTGAQYWSAQRSTPKPGSCANPSMSKAWQDGCAAAQKRLALPDARRRSEADYKLGWNSWPGTPAGVTSASARSPVAQPGPSATPASIPQPAVSARQLWYYCDPVRAYYPYVSTCPIPWRAVVPHPSEQDQTPQHAPIAVVPQRQSASSQVAQPKNPSNLNPAPANLTVVPIEPDAVMLDDVKSSAKLINELVEMVKENDFRCDTVSSVLPFLLSANGFKLVCNNYRYHYDIEDKGGHWIVTAQ